VALDLDRMMQRMDGLLAEEHRLHDTFCRVAPGPKWGDRQSWPRQRQQPQSQPQAGSHLTMSGVFRPGLANASPGSLQ